MSWSTLVILVLLGFTINDSHAQLQRRDRQFGALIGDFRTLQHNVSGKVWAVDGDKLYIEKFSYDGLGPDAFFWIGNDSQPSPRGHIIRYPLSTPDGKPAVLPALREENLLLHLPPGMKITDMKWISVWCRRFTVDFGHVYIPADVDPPRKRTLPEFQRLAHGLRSGNITILDAKTFYIPNLHYDGEGPDAFFWVGNGTKPDPLGRMIPNERGGLERLRKYEGEDIELQLPEDFTVYDIDYLGVWCVTYKHNFGHVNIPPAEDLWVPPSLGQTRIKLDDLIEAYGAAYEEDNKDAYLPLPPPALPGRPQQPPSGTGQDVPHLHQEEEEEEEKQRQDQHHPHHHDIDHDITTSKTRFSSTTSKDFPSHETDNDSGSDPQAGSNNASPGTNSDLGNGAPLLQAPLLLLLLLSPLSLFLLIPSSLGMGHYHHQL